MELPFDLPRRDRSFSAAVQNWAGEIGLVSKMMGSLARYPGSQHWHFKRGGQPGIIELTIIPDQARGWFSMRRGRARGWKKQEVENLLRSLVRALR